MLDVRPLSVHELMEELPDETHDEIARLSAEGDSLAEHEQYAEAIRLYWEAFDLLPAPPERWGAATWLLAAIGDANYLGGDYEAGRDNLSVAMRCPDAIGNPFIHLRLGQCQFELGNLTRAADELARAYMGAGPEVFNAEDGKYFAFLKTRLKAPPTGW